MRVISSGRSESSSGVSAVKKGDSTSFWSPPWGPEEEAEFLASSKALTASLTLLSTRQPKDPSARPRVDILLLRVRATRRLTRPGMELHFSVAYSRATNAVVRA